MTSSLMQMTVLAMFTLTLMCGGVCAERIELIASGTFSNSSIWTPRAPIEGDDVVLDFSTCSSRSLRFDVDTPSFASINVSGSCSRCPPTVYVGEGVRVVTSRYEQDSSISLVLEGGAQLRAHVFEAMGIISGNGRIITGAVAQISATLAPGMYACSTWGSDASEYGDLVFEGLGQAVANVKVFLRNALPPPQVGRYPGDTVTFTSVNFNGTEFVWQSSGVSAPNDTSVLPVSYTAMTVETQFSFTFGAFSCPSSFTFSEDLNSGSSPGGTDSQLSPTKPCSSLNGGGLGFLLQSSPCQDVVPCPSCANGICTGAISFCQCFVGWSGATCDVARQVASGGSDSTSETSSFFTTDTPASSGQEGLSQGAIIGIAVGVSAAAVIFVVALFLVMRAHRRSSTMEMTSRIRAKELQEMGDSPSL